MISGTWPASKIDQAQRRGKVSPAKFACLSAPTFVTPPSIEPSWSNRMPPLLVGPLTGHNIQVYTLSLRRPDTFGTDTFETVSMNLRCGRILVDVRQQS